MSVRSFDRLFIGGRWVRPATDGFKQSGLGREGGVEGIHPYLETKMIQGA